MTTRFPADLPYDDTLPLITVGDLVNQGKTAEAVSFMEANQKACANALGAVGYWRDKYVPVVPTETKPKAIGRGQEVPWFDSPKDQVNVTIANDDGRVSMSDSGGGADDWMSKDPGFPIVEGVTVRASGQSGFLDVKAGDKMYSKQTSQANASIHITMSS